MALPDSYYVELAEHYRVRRDRLLRVLRDTGFEPIVPKGAYYIMCDISAWGYPTDVDFCRFLVKEAGVAAVPGSSFFRNPVAGKDLIRFTFCKREETLAAAEERLKKLQAKQISRPVVKEVSVTD